MARRYGLPYRSSGSLTNSQTPDAQAIYDTQWSMWPAMLAHANFIHHAVGWMEGGLVASYEKFIIDMENLGMFAHFMRGFSMDDDAFALDMIEQVGPGGHHFGTSHTQAGYETAFYQPFLTDRQNFESWQAAGAEDAPQRAHKIWREMLKQYEAPPLDVAIQDELADFVARRERELAGVDLYA
jgi:trimethylamine--corrinoid protein Co-methyltransferase